MSLTLRGTESHKLITVIMGFLLLSEPPTALHTPLQPRLLLTCRPLHGPKLSQKGQPRENPPHCSFYFQLL